jgi:hypothetical protein
VEVARALRQRVNEILGGHDILGVAAIHHPAGKHGALAQVFARGAAVSAHTASLVQPGDAHHLVAGHDGRFARSEFTLDHVEAGAADAAGVDPYEHLAGGRLGLDCPAPAATGSRRRRVQRESNGRTATRRIKGKRLAVY